VIHAFNQRGLAALDPQWAGGRPRRISPDDERVIVQTAKTRPEKLRCPFTHWSIRKLAGYLADNPVGVVAVGRERLRQLLHHHQISFQRAAQLFDDVGVRSARPGALELAGPGLSPYSWRAPAALGHGLYLAGRSAEVRPQLDQLVRRVSPSKQPYAVIIALAVLSLLAGDENDDRSAAAFARRAASAAEAQGLSGLRMGSWSWSHPGLPTPPEPLTTVRKKQRRSRGGSLPSPNRAIRASGSTTTSRIRERSMTSHRRPRNGPRGRSPSVRTSPESERRTSPGSLSVTPWPGGCSR
jgi:hypothetical protein